jgi:muramoyltetrapeptide carboxypeptidase
MLENLKKPPYLKIGDKVAIVCTARKITTSEINFAINFLQDWGLKIVLGKTIDLAYHQFAGTDIDRAEDFQNMMDDSSIKAIFCARGGYGTVRIMEHLNFTGFTLHPKWIVGYSDVTILHAHINNYLGIQTLHASMPVNFQSNTAASLLSLKESLRGINHAIEIPSNVLNKNGYSEGLLVGGNLSILYSILGTSSGFNPDHKILFIEDLDEYLYHIDRMMMALKRAGKLAKLKGLIVGGMTKMNDNKIPFGKQAEEIIKEHCEEYNYPICFNAPCGHIDDNRALQFGNKYTLAVSESKVTLSL